MDRFHLALRVVLSGLPFVTAGPYQPIDEDGRLEKGNRCVLNPLFHIVSLGKMFVYLLFKPSNRYLGTMLTRLVGTAIKASWFNTE